MESKLKVIFMWLKESRLKVNESKTEACIFYWNDTPHMEICVKIVSNLTKDHINIVGIISDGKSWNNF